MAGEIRFNITASTGVFDEARTDGLDDGSVVTIEFQNQSATTYLITLLDVPETDTVSEGNLVQTGTPYIWEFTPPSGSDSWGSYRVLPTEDGTPEQIRTFGIKTDQSLLIPATNERADDTASLVNEGPAVISASENNEPRPNYPGGSWRGYAPAVADLYLAVNEIIRTSSIPGLDNQVVRREGGILAAGADLTMTGSLASPVLNVTGTSTAGFTMTDGTHIMRVQTDGDNPRLRATSTAPLLIQNAGAGNVAVENSTFGSGDALIYPTSDGPLDSVITSDGSGTLSLSSLVGLAGTVGGGDSTGVLTGLEVTINGGDSALFDIAAGTGAIWNWAGGTPVYTKVTFAGVTGVAVTDIGSSLFTALFINAAGSVVQFQDTVPTANQRRELIVLQILGHESTTIDTVSGGSQPAYDVAQAAIDYITALGPVNTGNLYSAAAANLTVEKSGGITTLPFINRDVDTQNPSSKVNALTSPTSIIYSQRDGGGDFDFNLPAVTDVDVGFFDDGSGTLAAVSPTSRFTIKRGYFFGQTQSATWTYGQALYNSIELAEAAIFTENPEVSPRFAGATFTTAIIVRGNATDLSDTAQAKFVPITLGAVSAGGTGAVTSVTSIASTSLITVTPTTTDVVIDILNQEIDLAGGNTFYGPNTGNTGSRNVSATVNTGVGSGSFLVLNLGVGNGSWGADNFPLLTDGNANQVFGRNSGGGLVDGNNCLFFGNNLSAPASDTSDYITFDDAVFVNSLTKAFRVGGAGVVSGQSIFQVVNNATDDTSPVIFIENSSAIDGADVQMRFGNRDPGAPTAINAIDGSIYFQVSDASSTILVNTSVTSGTSWFNLKHAEALTNSAGIVTIDGGAPTIGQLVVATSATTAAWGQASFIAALADTPSSFGGQGGKVAVVNDAETALEFTTVATGGGGTLEYGWSTDIVDDDPGSGDAKGNDATQANITQLNVSDFTDNGVDVSDVLALRGSGDVLMFTEESDSSRFFIYVMNGAAVDQTTYWEFPGVVTQNGNPIRDGRLMAVQVFSSGGSGTPTEGAAGIIQTSDGAGGFTSGNLVTINESSIALRDPYTTASSSGGILALDFSVDQFIEVTLTENITTINITMPPGPSLKRLRIIQDPVTPRSMTGWTIAGGAVRWQGSVEFGPTLIVDAIDRVVLDFDATNIEATYGLSFGVA